MYLLILIETPYTIVSFKISICKGSVKVICVIRSEPITTDGNTNLNELFPPLPPAFFIVSSLLWMKHFDFVCLFVSFISRFLI